jgi:hypothetical protein
MQRLKIFNSLMNDVSMSTIDLMIETFLFLPQENSSLLNFFDNYLNCFQLLAKQFSIITRF